MQECLQIFFRTLKDGTKPNDFHYAAEEASSPYEGNLFFDETQIAVLSKTIKDVALGLAAESLGTAFWEAGAIAFHTFSSSTSSVAKSGFDLAHQALQAALLKLAPLVASYGTGWMIDRLLNAYIEQLPPDQKTSAEYVRPWLKTGCHFFYTLFSPLPMVSRKDDYVVYHVPRSGFTLNHQDTQVWVEQYSTVPFTIYLKIEHVLQPPIHLSPTSTEPQSEFVRVFEGGTVITSSVISTLGDVENNLPPSRYMVLSHDDPGSTYAFKLPVDAEVIINGTTVLGANLPAVTQSETTVARSPFQAKERGIPLRPEGKLQDRPSAFSALDWYQAPQAAVDAVSQLFGAASIEDPLRMPSASAAAVTLSHTIAQDFLAQALSTRHAHGYAYNGDLLPGSDIRVSPCSSDQGRLNLLSTQQVHFYRVLQAGNGNNLKALIESERGVRFPSVELADFFSAIAYSDAPQRSTEVGDRILNLHEQAKIPSDKLWKQKALSVTIDAIVVSLDRETVIKAIDGKVGAVLLTDNSDETQGFTMLATLDDDFQLHVLIAVNGIQQQTTDSTLYSDNNDFSVRKKPSSAFLRQRTKRSPGDKKDLGFRVLHTRTFVKLI